MPATPGGAMSLDTRIRTLASIFSLLTLLSYVPGCSSVQPVTKPATTPVESWNAEVEALLPHESQEALEAEMPRKQRIYYILHAFVRHGNPDDPVTLIITTLANFGAADGIVENQRMLVPVKQIGACSEPITTIPYNQVGVVSFVAGGADAVNITAVPHQGISWSWCPKIGKFVFPVASAAGTATSP